MRQQSTLDRRGFVASTAAAAAFVLLGCSEAAQSQPAAPAKAAEPTKMPTKMMVYRDPSCPCCEKWAALAGKAGYAVEMIDHPDMPAIKAQYGVPDELRSCHTAVVAGYAIEGHVPLDQVARLVAERPAGVIGIGVAGMPLGSPGMEAPGAKPEDFTVMAFGKDGTTAPFAT